MSQQLVPGHEQLIWDELESCAVPSFFLPPLLYVPVVEVVVVVVVLGETSAERTLAIITTGTEVFREPPLLVVTAIAWHFFFSYSFGIEHFLREHFSRPWPY